MENDCEENRQTGFPPMVSIDKRNVMSLNQVTPALKILAIYHGTWWVWLRRKKREGFNEYVDSLMDVEDVETAFSETEKDGHMVI